MKFVVGHQFVRQRFFLTSVCIIVGGFIFFLWKYKNHLSYGSTHMNLLHCAFKHALKRINFTQPRVTDFTTFGFDLKNDTLNSSINYINKNKDSGTNSFSFSYWDTLMESNVLTGTQIMEYFMWSNRTSCRLAHDFGGKILGNPSGKDGQKAVCLDPKVAPQPNRKCLVYSFGIRNEWSFDEEMEQYGCEVFAFDPSMKTKPHDHSLHIHFYNWGLSDRDEMETRDNGSNWQMYSLSSVYKILSASHGPKVIDYLKMDIEASEWKVLPNIIKTGMLSKVRQLGFEFHLPDYPVENFIELVKLVRVIESMGMVRFDSKYNPWYIRNFTQLQLWDKPAGYEIAWYNSKLFHSAAYA